MRTFSCSVQRVTRILPDLVSDVGILTTYQVARSLGLTRAAVCLAVKEGRLRPVGKLPGVNGAYLFDRAAVDAWRGVPMFDLAPVA